MHHRRKPEAWCSGEPPSNCAPGSVADRAVLQDLASVGANGKTVRPPPSYLCSLASSVILPPALETSWPAPATVLHALRKVDVAKRTTRIVKAMARLLR